MKKNNRVVYIIIGIVIALIIISLIKEFNYKKIDGIEEFNYHYYGGWDTRNNVYYEINCNDKCIGKFRIKEEDYRETSIDEETMNELVKLLNIYHISKWNGFNKDLGFTDSPSFGLEIKTEKGETIKAEGHSSFPRNHDKFKEELNKLFKEVV